MGRTFAVSDLHGMIDLYRQIKNFLKPEDKVYYLGDMGDRGTDCWETVKAIMDDPQFECLMGNHEDMLLKVMKIYLRTPEEEKDQVQYCHDAAMLSYNGGMPTFKGWTKESAADRSKWYKRIKDLPLFLEYYSKSGKHIYMSHAGFTPYSYEDIPDRETLLWDRDHFMYEWPRYEAPEDVIILHGHTPIPYIVDDIHRFSRGAYELPKLPCAYWYSGGHKCCIDNGAFYYLCTVLLDLDTFEEHKFYDKDYDPDAWVEQVVEPEEDEEKWQEELDLLNLMISGV